VVAIRSPEGCQATLPNRPVLLVRVVIFWPVWGFQMMQEPMFLLSAVIWE